MLVFSSDGQRASEADETTLLRSARARVVPAVVDSLVHDARNPLNAMSINLELLRERLRREQGGALSAPCEKNLQTIRVQIERLDEVLRRFTELLSDRAPAVGHLDFSALVLKVAAVVGPELRRRRALLQTRIEPAAMVAPRAEAIDLVLQLMWCGVAQTPSAGQLKVALRGDAGTAVLEVTARGERVEAPDPLSLRAMELSARHLGGRLEVEDEAIRIYLPTV